MHDEVKSQHTIGTARWRADDIVSA